jgi:hypothetical protein
MNAIPNVIPEPLSNSYEPIDRQYYISSIIHDVKNASKDIIEILCTYH